MGHLDQQKKLRELVKPRIGASEYTVTELASKLHIHQSTLSNFLGKKRSVISPQLVDRILILFGIDQVALLPDPLFPRAADFETVPLVSSRDAINAPVVTPGIVEQNLKVDLASLKKLPRYCAKLRRQDWTRFIAVKVDAAQAAFMQPILQKNAEIIIDRHYQRIDFFFKGRRPIYAVADRQALRLGFVSVRPGQIILRPPSLDVDMHTIEIKKDQRPTQFIVGRVCKGWTDY